MADFQPRFVDLVRSYTSTVGTGAFVLGPAVNGFTGFGSALQTGDSFYYSAIGVDKPAEREVGRGTLLANGTISRQAISGSLTNFSSGTKSLALIAPAEWFNAVQSSAGTAPATAATRSALAASTLRQMPALLTERGREGLFLFDSSNLSAAVSADSRQGIYVAPSSDPTGASGAWVRKYSGEVDVRWFGAAGDDTTDDGPAFAGAIAYLKSTRSAASYGEGSAGLLISAGKYFLGTTTLDLTHGLRIAGHSLGEAGGQASQLRWAAGATGIRVQRFNTTGASGSYSGTPNTNGGDASIIEKLELKGGYTSADAECHAIHLRARATLRDLYIENWQGDGVYVNCTAGSGGATEGNANNLEASRLFIQGCRNGVYLNGADVNAGVFTSISTIANRQWGISDNSFLGNTFVACHAASNTSGPYKTTNLNAVSVFVGCYSETDQPPASFVNRTLVLGGLHGAGTGSYGGHLYSQGGQLVAAQDLIVSRNLQVNGAITAMGPQSGAAADNIFFFDTTNFNTYLYGRSWAAGVPQTDGLITFHRGFGIDLNAVQAGTKVRLQVQGNDIASAQGDGLHVTGIGAFSGALSASNLSGTNSGDQTITLTGDVTGSGTGSFAATIAANAVTTAKIANSAVSYAKVQNVSATSKLLGRASAGAGVIEELGLAGGLTMSGTNLTLGALTPTSVAATAGITSSGATNGVGYATGAGGAVTQTTNKTTAVTINKASGQITTSNASLAAAAIVSFTVNNSAVAATDTIELNLASGNAGAGTYRYWVEGIAAGSFKIVLENRSAGALGEALVFNFALLKAVNA
jgi:hypothetical protein